MTNFTNTNTVALISDMKAAIKASNGISDKVVIAIRTCIESKNPSAISPVVTALRASNFDVKSPKNAAIVNSLIAKFVAYTAEVDEDDNNIQLENGDYKVKGNKKALDRIMNKQGLFEDMGKVESLSNLDSEQVAVMWTNLAASFEKYIGDFECTSGAINIFAKPNDNRSDDQIEADKAEKLEERKESFKKDGASKAAKQIESMGVDKYEHILEVIKHLGLSSETLIEMLNK